MTTPKRDASPASVNVARAAVLLDGQRFGAIPCPLCRQADRAGSLSYSVSKRGQVYARCSNRTCVVVFR
jgi:hypothetical protein